MVGTANTVKECANTVGCRLSCRQQCFPFPRHHIKKWSFPRHHVTVRVRHKIVGVDHALIEDQTVVLGVGNHSQFFRGWIWVEKVGVDDDDTPSCVLRGCEFVPEVLTEDVVIEPSTVLKIAPKNEAVY